MHRMGHATTGAALIYQHTNEQRDREIAAGLDEQIAKELIGQATRTARISIDVRKSRSRSRSRLTWAFVLERVKGAEPSLSAWQLVTDHACKPVGTV